MLCAGVFFALAPFPRWARLLAAQHSHTLSLSLVFLVSPYLHPTFQNSTHATHDADAAGQWLLAAWLSEIGLDAMGRPGRHRCGRVLNAPLLAGARLTMAACGQSKGSCKAQQSPAKLSSIAVSSLQVASASFARVPPACPRAGGAETGGGGRRAKILLCLARVLQRILSPFCGCG